jgi:hypothetical protein
MSDPLRSDRPAIARGRVARTPVSADDELIVTIDDFSGEHEYNVPPGQWDGSSPLPVEGDACLVLRDSESDRWVPMIVRST